MYSGYFVLFFKIIMFNLVTSSTPITKPIGDLILHQTREDLRAKCEMVTLGVPVQLVASLLTELRERGIFIQQMHVKDGVDPKRYYDYFVKSGRCVFVVSNMVHPFLPYLDKVIQRYFWKSLILIQTTNDTKNIETLISEKNISSVAYVLSVLKNASHGFGLKLGCPNGPVPMTSLVDVWRPSKGFLKIPQLGLRFVKSVCYNNRSPLLGKSITVSVIGIPPYITFNPKTKALGGVDFDLFKLVVQKFRLNVTLREESSWLDKLPNGSLIGSVYSVAKGMSDMAIGDIGLMQGRFQMIDYTVVLYGMENGYVSRKPKQLEKYKNVVLPFDYYCWCSIAAFALAVSLTVLVLDWGFLKRIRENSYYESLSKTLDIWIFPAIILVTQTEPSWLRRDSKNIGSKVVITFWLIGCTVFISCYISNLSASLISVEREAPIDTTERVLAEGDPVYFPRGSFIDLAMKTSPRKALRDLHKMIERLNPYVDYQGGSLPIETMRKITKAGTGIATKDLYFYVEDLNYRQNLSFLLYFGKEIFFAVNTVGKHSYLKNELDPVLLNLIERGILNKFFKAFKTNVMDENPRALSKLSVSHILSVTFFLITFSTISVIAFLCEFNLKPKRENRNGKEMIQRMQ